MTWCPWPSFHAPSTVSKFYVVSRKKVHFSAAVIAWSMKPCIVIVLDTLNTNTLWPGAIDLHFMLHWLCQNFMLSQKIKYISLQQWIAGSMKPCIVIVFDTLFEHTPWPGAFDLHFTLHWLCPNFMLSLEIKCMSLQQPWLWVWNLAKWLSLTPSSSTHHDSFFAWLTLHAYSYFTNAGAISTSEEVFFLYW